MVATDEEKDLALLQITRDVFGREVDGISFPALPLDPDVPVPALGDRLVVAGYPAEGSDRSRTPVIMTRGAVAGLERRGDALRWIKTDAWIGPGHSGGGVVDASFRLVGVAAATLGPKAVLGLVVPVSALPDGWRERIAGQRPDTD